MTRALLQQALDALEANNEWHLSPLYRKSALARKNNAAIDALRAELANLEREPFFQFRECEDSQAGQPEQEPRPPNCGTGHCSCIECHDPAYRAMVRGAAQPAQELTDEQKQEIHNQTGAGHALICLVESYIRAGSKS
jgi:hypothetical protein